GDPHLTPSVLICVQSATDSDIHFSFQFPFVIPTVESVESKAEEPALPHPPLPTVCHSDRSERSECSGGTCTSPNSPKQSKRHSPKAVPFRQNSLYKFRLSNPK